MMFEVLLEATMISWDTPYMYVVCRYCGYTLVHNVDIVAIVWYTL